MVYPRNPKREAALLNQWRNGIPARQAALNTGIPEGTTFYYYRKFNRDPEKANRLARSHEPEEERSLHQKMADTRAASEVRKFQTKYDKLIEEGKYAEAKSLAEAEGAARHYRRDVLRGCNNVIEFRQKQEAESTNELARKRGNMSAGSSKPLTTIETPRAILRKTETGRYHLEEKPVPTVDDPVTTRARKLAKILDEYESRPGPKLRDMENKKLARHRSRDLQRLVKEDATGDSSQDSQ